MKTKFLIAICAASLSFALPVSAQYSGGWKMPSYEYEETPSQGNTRYRYTPPQIQTPNYDDNRTPRTPSKGFGHGSGSYWGW